MIRKLELNKLACTSQIFVFYQRCTMKKLLTQLKRKDLIFLYKKSRVEYNSFGLFLVGMISPVLLVNILSSKVIRWIFLFKISYIVIKFKKNKSIYKQRYNYIKNGVAIQNW